MILSPLVSLGSLVLLAAPPQLTDFSHGLELDTEGSGPVHVLDLPEEVYRRALRPDLGDLRVFNKGREVVSHAVGHRPEVIDPARWIEVPIFPLMGRSDGGVDELQVTVERKGSEVVVATKSSNAGAIDTLVGYLVDLSAVREDVDRLSLSWPSPGGNLIARLNVGHSCALDYFNNIGGGAVAELRQGEQAILRPEIPFSSQRECYLRVSSATNQAMPMSLTSAKVRAIAKVLPPEPRWLDLTGKPGTEPNTWDYEAELAAPFDRVRLGLVSDNTVVRARISVVTAATDEAPESEREVASALFYRMSQNGESVENDPERFVPTRSRKFRVHLIAGALGANEAPRLSVGYVPERLWFVAKGEGPFTIAYGSGTIVGDGIAAAELRNLDGGEESTAYPRGSERVLGGDAAREDTLGKVKSQRTGILWGVLVVGLIGLVFMALRLVRELRQSPPGGSEPPPPTA